LELHALGLLCGLGATSLATWTAGSLRGRAVFLAGLLVGTLFLGADRFPGPSWIATTTVVVAALTLWKPAWSVVAVFCGGVLAGLWVSVLQLQGLPFAPALFVAVVLPAVAAYLAVRRTGFATPKLREEALIVLIGFGLAMAIAPEVTAGWRSALELKATPLGAESPGGAGWVFLFGGFCALFGGLYSLWRRR